eukprot:Nk52_evm14s245 gene=Nk52_evmTU14s245
MNACERVQRYSISQIDKKLNKISRPGELEPGGNSLFAARKELSGDLECASRERVSVSVKGEGLEESVSVGSGGSSSVKGRSFEGSTSFNSGNRLGISFIRYDGKDREGLFSFSVFDATRVISGQTKRLDVCDRDGNTAAHWAVRNEHTKYLEVLMIKGLKVDSIPNKMGELPIHWGAMYSRDISCLRKLYLASPRSINAVTLGGDTPLHKMSSRNCPAMVSALIKWGANVLAVNKEGQTPMHVACEAGLPNVLEVLIMHVENIQQIGIMDKKGNNLGHMIFLGLSSGKGNLEGSKQCIMTLLRSYRVLFSMRNAQGLTPHGEGKSRNAPEELLQTLNLDSASLSFQTTKPRFSFSYNSGFDPKYVQGPKQVKENGEQRKSQLTEVAEEIENIRAQQHTDHSRGRMTLSPPDAVENSGKRESVILREAMDKALNRTSVEEREFADKDLVLKKTRSGTCTIL